ncbi:MAG TPA: GNAT family N-acetyltransferase [Microscillaceae bacterium]|nr:GNAT family N-acetyltransferase [Microscillaceae bacterium]
MTSPQYTLRNAQPEEHAAIGQLMVKVYAQLEGFATPAEQPKYYETLTNVGSFTQNPGVELLVAVSAEGAIGGAVVFFDDMQFYASGGKATQEKNAAGFRLLAVDPTHRGHGLGRLLTEACIDKAKEAKVNQLIIHSTNTMKVAWKMYENMGFQRSTDLDFMQGEIQVCGFRLILKN